jgi:hypothetical protein
MTYGQAASIALSHVVGKVSSLELFKAHYGKELLALKVTTDCGYGRQ